MKQPISILTRRNFAVGTAALSALGLLAPAPSAYAQGKYPTRSPRLVLPFAAGGVADVTARIVAEKLGDVLGHRFIVDNQPGAGGINAANTVRSARPDGYALALLSNGTAVSVGLFNNLPFDPVKDFTPISSMGYFDFLFCVNASSSFQSMADFVKTAREKPRTLNIGTIHIGSSQNLTAELLKLTAIRITKDRLAKSNAETRRPSGAGHRPARCPSGHSAGGTPSAPSQGRRMKPHSAENTREAAVPDRPRSNR
jgi:tripartite-type tricarboxylate transporter receptor subunit TctC